MKKNITFLIVLILIFSVLTTIIIHITNPSSLKKNNKVEIIATLFPQYDFVKQIGGEKVNVTLLLPPGAESHTYEPTPQDMVKINNSDLFIYTGEEMEPWANNLISGMKNDINVLDLSTTVKLINVEEFEEEHSSSEGEGHVHSDEEDNSENEEHAHSEEQFEDEEHEHNEEQFEDGEYEHNEEDNSSKEKHGHYHNKEQHHHSYDPHIWLNPLYAIQMVESIENQLCEIDPENAEYYRNNANDYIKQIQQLDNEFEETVNNSKTQKLAFGGAFAYAYFIERYNLDFATAYQACGESTEPSTSQIKEVIDYINQNKLPVVFYKEYTNGNVAKTISESTGASMLVFNTVHNLSKEEIEDGATYVSIMKQNLENLKEALK